jgi:hypothetical protein
LNINSNINNENEDCKICRVCAGRGEVQVGEEGGGWRVKEED